MKLMPLLLIGAGGHAAACIDVVEQAGCFDIVGLVAPATESGKQLFGYSVLGADEDLPALLGQFPNVLIAVGQIKTPQPRIRLFDLLEQLGCVMPVVVSKSAYVSKHATIGIGSIIMHGAVVNAGAVVGRNCIVNSQAVVEHDVVIGDHCHVATSATINGGACVGTGTFIGSGSTVRESVVIGDQCRIGMGQQVLVNCESRTQLPRKSST